MDARFIIMMSGYFSWDFPIGNFSSIFKIQQIHELMGGQMHDKTVNKLLHKDAMYQLEWDLKNKFDFSEILADALMQRMRILLEENNSDNLGAGEIHNWGVKKNEPSGKSLDEMEKEQIKLTLYHPDDHELLREQGIRPLRQCKIMRMTIEAKEQGVLLTQDDLALLLCCTDRTIRNDVRELRKMDIAIPTRGQIKDIGKGVSHKAKIVEKYLKGYEYSEIRCKTHHSDASIDLYIHDFLRVVYLASKDENISKIRQVTRLSERLIQEYLELYEKFSRKDCPRLKDLIKNSSTNLKKRSRKIT